MLMWAMVMMVLMLLWAVVGLASGRLWDAMRERLDAYRRQEFHGRYDPKPMIEMFNILAERSRCRDQQEEAWRALT